LADSLTGEVACSKVMRAHQGWLIPDGNREVRAKTKASLTATLTGEAREVDRFAITSGPCSELCSTTWQVRKQVLVILEADVASARA